MSLPESGVDFLMAEVAARIAAYLRQAFPGPSTTKQVALAFDVAVDTAKGWLGGQMPINRHLLAMKARFGAAFVAFIYEPMSWAGAYSLRARLDDLRAGIDELRSELDRQEKHLVFDLRARGVLSDELTAMAFMWFPGMSNA